MTQGFRPVIQGQLTKDVTQCMYNLCEDWGTTLKT
jgi:hypothetical protein